MLIKVAKISMKNKTVAFEKIEEMKRGEKNAENTKTDIAKMDRI